MRERTVLDGDKYARNGNLNFFLCNAGNDSRRGTFTPATSTRAFNFWCERICSGATSPWCDEVTSVTRVRPERGPRTDMSHLVRETEDRVTSTGWRRARRDVRGIDPPAPESVMRQDSRASVATRDHGSAREN